MMETPTQTSRHQVEEPPKQLSAPWLRPVEKVLVSLAGFVIVPALVSLSFPPAWHQAFFVFQVVLVCYSLPFYIVLGIRGYDEQRVGNTKAERELLGLSGLFVCYFIAATAFREVTWPLWIQSIMLILLLLMVIRAHNNHRNDH
jgi:hypothetical protein